LQKNLPVQKKDLETKVLSIDQIQLHGVQREYSQNLVNCYFEENVSLESMALISSRGSFIGAYSYMNGGGHIRENVFIARYCSIGRRVTIGAGMHYIHGLSNAPIIRKGTARPYNTSEWEALKINKKNKGHLTIIDNDA
jgi:NDP-sugar pyrophosphorylase family protein